MMARPEDALQTQVAAYLNVALPDDATWMHPANGGYRTKVEAAIFKRMGVKPGAADLIFCHQGRALAIELKIGKGVQSSAQAAWQDSWEAAGGKYAICRSLESVIDTLTEWGVPLKARAA